MIWLFIIIAVVVFAVVAARRMGFFPKNHALGGQDTEGYVRILMYHKFTENRTETDFLTITAGDFEEQIKHAQSIGFQFITSRQLAEFYAFGKPLPPRPLLVTFDDAYCSQLEIAAPILRKHAACATVFVPTKYVGTGSNWDGQNAAPILSAEELKQLDPSLFELALHTHAHVNYKNLPLADIERDVDDCLAFFDNHKMPFAPTFSYAYGGRPKNRKILRGLKKYFAERNILLAFRIGNRINSLKINDLYELQRIDVRGDESFEIFKKKLNFGRVKLF